MSERTLRIIGLCISLTLTVTSGVLAFSDQIKEVVAFNPKLAHAWMFILLSAGIVDRCFRLIAHFLFPQQFGEPAPVPQVVAPEK